MIAENFVCRDLSGTVTVERTPGGIVFSKHVTVPEKEVFRKEVTRLEQEAGVYAAPFSPAQSTEDVLTFNPGGWEPFRNWLSGFDKEPFYPLERALGFAVDLCNALQKISTSSAGKPEIHAGMVLVSDSRLPHCRIILCPAVNGARPADYLACSSEVLFCTPPESFCGQQALDPYCYAAAMILRVLFSDTSVLNRNPAAMMEKLVEEGFPTPEIAPANLPEGMNKMLSPQWEKLAGMIGLATARNPKVRAVQLEEFLEVCQAILKELDYWRLVKDLCDQGRFEEACDVCSYGIWAKQNEASWRRALKRQLGEIYFKRLHNYAQAASVFQEYVNTESSGDFSAAAQVIESHGDALAALGENTAALQQYERALPFIADRPPLYMKVAGIHRRSGNYTGAVNTLQRLLQDYPHQWQALQNLAEVYLEMGDTASAHDSASLALQAVRDLYQRKALHVRFPEAIFADLHALLGLCFLFQENSSAAQTLAAQALEEDPECFRAFNVFGLLYIRQGKTLPALRSLTRSLLLNPDQPEIQKWMEEALGKGVEQP